MSLKKVSVFLLSSNSANVPMRLGAAEKKACMVKRTSWSPAFSKAVEEKAFWKIALSLRRTYIKLNDKFLAWASSRNIEDFAKIDTQTIICKLWKAQKGLREIKKRADQLREDHLRELLKITQDSYDDRQHD
jgi:hypothetical protein